MTVLKFNIRKVWYERGKEITVEADQLFDVQADNVARQLLESGHASLPEGVIEQQPKRRGRPPRYENKDEGQRMKESYLND